VNSDIKILDDNLISSQCDTFERLWILCRINGIKTAVGVVYFPNDGVDKNKTDLLFYELLENCSVFQSHGYETCLTGILMVKAYVNANLLENRYCVKIIRV
jgi:hypothetical protein